MSFLVNNFNDGQILDASHLNTIEQEIINSEKDRIYPITKTGYFSASCSEVSNSQYEKCTFDVRKYRGSTIIVNASPNTEGYCTLIGSSTTDIIEQWNTGNVKYLRIPEKATKLYISNDWYDYSDFNIEVPKTKNINKGFLFYEDFQKSSTIDYNDISGHKINGTLSEDGLVLNTGISNAIILNKVFLADEWSCVVDVETITNKEVIYLSTRTTQGSCSHGTMLCVDFENSTIKLAKGSAGTSVPTSFYKKVDMSDVIKSVGGVDNNHLYTIKLEKANGPIRASITNKFTGKQVIFLAGLETVEQENESSTGLTRGKSPVGRMYDSPQLFVQSGSPKIKRWYGKTWVSNPKMMFFGDSITQGTHNLPDDVWCVKCSRYFGNSITCGRGSADIWCCVNTVRSMVPILRPKSIVVTIGTNGGDYKLYQKFIDICEYFGIILILNTCWACDGRSNVKSLNTQILKLNQLGSRLDLATSKNNVVGSQDRQYFASDGTHLSPLGNELTYNTIIRDFNWFKEDKQYINYSSIESDEYNVYLILDKGITYSGDTTVKKGEVYTSTLTLDSGCSLGSEGITVVMRYGELKNAHTVSDSTISINIPEVTGDIYIYADVTDSSTPSEPDTDIDLPTEDKELVKTDFEIFDNTWIMSSGTSIGVSQDGYFTAYYPIKGYKTLDITAQDKFTTYYQFCIDEDLIDLTGERLSIEAGQTQTNISIPNNALYLIVASHRTNSTSEYADNGYAEYFPKYIKAYI